jgi:glycerol uptake facilitator-like aquaporin
MVPWHALGLMILMRLISNSFLKIRSNFGVSLVYFTSLIVFGRLSGGHFNPICTLIGFIDGCISKRKAIYYVGSQLVAGLIAGMLLMPMFANSYNLPYYEQYSFY